MARPNILLVVTHDSGRHFGCYGAGVQTPNIDRLAAGGVRFDRAFCTAPQCSPARGSMMTGLYPHRHGLMGLINRGFVMDPDVPRLPGLLGKAGYHTLLFGLQHEAPEAHQMGYRRVVRGESNRIPAVLPEVESYLGSQPAEPFFACVGFTESHRPYDSARYPMDDPRQVTVPRWLPDEPPVREDVAELNGVIRGIDEAVGRIDSALAGAGLAEETLLIYTTDHGIPFPGAKATLLEAGLEVALVARGPGGFAGGKVVTRLVSTMDLTPTLLELAGAQPPSGLDGRSLLPLLADADAPWRDHLFAEMTYHAAYDPMRGIRTEQHKYIRCFVDRPVMFPPNVDEGATKALLVKRGLHRQPRRSEMLFDLAADPAEQRNLVGQPGADPVLEELRRRVGRWMEQTDDPLLAGAVPLPDGALATPAGGMTPTDMDAPDDWRG